MGLDIVVLDCPAYPVKRRLSEHDCKAWFFDTNNSPGYNLQDALDKQFDGLACRDQEVFPGTYKKVRYYVEVSRKVVPLRNAHSQVYDYQVVGHESFVFTKTVERVRGGAGRPISLEAVVVQVAQAVEGFIKHVSPSVTDWFLCSTVLQTEKMTTNGGHLRFGAGGIELRDMFVLELQQRGKTFQPLLACKRNAIRSTEPGKAVGTPYTPILNSTSALDYRFPTDMTSTALVIPDNIHGEGPSFDISQSTWSSERQGVPRSLVTSLPSTSYHRAAQGYPDASNVKTSAIPVIPLLMYTSVFRFATVSRALTSLILDCLIMESCPSGQPLPIQARPYELQRNTSRDLLLITRTSMLSSPVTHNCRLPLPRRCKPTLPPSTYILRFTPCTPPAGICTTLPTSKEHPSRD